MRVAREVAGGRRTLRSVWEPRLLEAVNLLSRPLATSTTDDPYHRTIAWFLEQPEARERVLEVGARNSTMRARLAPTADYVGLDVHRGRDVDVAGDVHELSSIVDGPFDAVISISTFEHLAMPWQAVLEINRVCRDGALVLVTTHPAWPPHEQPWDFWRFSAAAFGVLFGAPMGFELVHATEGLPGVILPLGTEASTRTVHRIPVSMGVSIVARKIGEPDPRLRWDLTARDVLRTSYPLPRGVAPCGACE
ncbi:MAG: class I SAM-dependent methyltransferase [Actinomycetota bacterium]